MDQREKRRPSRPSSKAFRQASIWQPLDCGWSRFVAQAQAQRIWAWFVLVLISGCGTTYRSHPAAVFIGDSITYLWSQPWSQQAAFQQNDWLDIGITGQNSSQIASRFTVEALGLEPKVVHILAGTNDVYPGWVLSDTSNNIRAMVEAAKRRGIPVVIGTIPPWGPGALPERADPSPQRYQRIDRLNTWLIEFGAQQGVPVVDYHALLVSSDGKTYVPALTLDGVHPSAAGFKLMTPAAERAFAAAVAPVSAATEPGGEPSFAGIDRWFVGQYRSN